MATSQWLANITAIKLWLCRFDFFLPSIYSPVSMIAFFLIHIRAVVRSGAGTPQVPCQEWYRNFPFESFTQRFPECIIRILYAFIRMPHREFKSVSGSLLGFETDEGVMDWELNQGVWIQGPVAIASLQFVCDGIFSLFF